MGGRRSSSWRRASTSRTTRSRTAEQHAAVVAAVQNVTRGDRPRLRLDVAHGPCLQPARRRPRLRLSEDAHRRRSSTSARSSKAGSSHPHEPELDGVVHPLAAVPLDPGRPAADRPDPGPHRRPAADAHPGPQHPRRGVGRGARRSSCHLGDDIGAPADRLQAPHRAVAAVAGRAGHQGRRPLLGRPRRRPDAAHTFRLYPDGRATAPGRAGSATQRFRAWKEDLRDRIPSKPRITRRGHFHYARSANTTGGVSSPSWPLPLFEIERPARRLADRGHGDRDPQRASTSRSAPARSTPSWARTARASRPSPTPSSAAPSTRSPRAASASSGDDITDWGADVRGKAGMFLAFQYPQEIAGRLGPQLPAPGAVGPQGHRPVGARAAPVDHGVDGAPRHGPVVRRPLPQRGLLRRREEAQRDPADGDPRARARHPRRDRLGPRHRRPAGGRQGRAGGPRSDRPELGVLAHHPLPAPARRTSRPTWCTSSSTAASSTAAAPSWPSDSRPRATTHGA